jgi:hypothetical protein
MTPTQYLCATSRRREAVRSAIVDGRPLLNGIDYLEVESADQRTLSVTCIHELAGPIPHLLIEGGTRITGIRAIERAVSGNVLTVRVNSAGDFSRYTLRLVRSAEDPQPPEGFDPQLALVSFSFKVACPSDFDCRSAAVRTAEFPAEPDINYLAKDYATFRRLMFDRLSLLMPEWRERSPADLQVALIELLAYVGDHLSYYQDAVATEAYLGTARRRVSIRRHARLLDYFMHDGSNARVWVALSVEPGSTADGATLPRGTRLLTRGAGNEPTVRPRDFATVAAVERPEVFETMHDLRLRSSHNAIPFYTWSDQDCRLPKGATRATLRDTLDGSERQLNLRVGDCLLFEAQAGEPGSGHVVRLIDVDNTTTDPLTGTPVVEIEWHAEDALPRCLQLSAAATGNVTAARGNLLLADHGCTMAGALLVPSVVPEVGSYRPRLGDGPLTFSAPFDPAASARAAITWNLKDARPCISLRGDDRLWTARYDLLSSSRFAPDFVVETESGAAALLRFGDGVLGLKPGAGATFTAEYRVGNGRRGNVGVGAVSRLVWDKTGVAAVRNPVAGTGGVDPESLEEVRQFAPKAFRRQERAVTEADYAEMAEQNPEVQKAAATVRWTGSWHTVFVTIDRKAGMPADATFRNALSEHLERYRMAGHDVEIDTPVFVPLDIALRVCVAAGYFRNVVKAGLMEVLGSGTFSSGQQRGFFHPDNFTFGQPVYLSQLYQAAMSVAGVASVEVTRFQRLGRSANHELENGVLATGHLEIVQLANDPNFPENGRLELSMAGAL